MLSASWDVYLNVVREDKAVRAAARVLQVLESSVKEVWLQRQEPAPSPRRWRMHFEGAILDSRDRRTAPCDILVVASRLAEDWIVSAPGLSDSTGFSFNGTLAASGTRTVQEMYDAHFHVREIVTLEEGARYRAGDSVRVRRNTDSPLPEMLEGRIDMDAFRSEGHALTYSVWFPAIDDWRIVTEDGLEPSDKHHEDPSPVEPAKSFVVTREANTGGVRLIAAR